MNQILLIYTILSILSVLIIVALIYFTFFKKLITKTHWLFITIGAVILIEGLTWNKYCADINDRLSIRLKVDNELYSVEEGVPDSTISKEILYKRLIDMRAPHAKIMYCQALIESASFTSANFIRNKNLFGMKIPTTRATSGNAGRAGYQNYNSWRESVTDYIIWQYDKNAENMSDREYLNYIGKIYAEDPNYAAKIKKLLTTINFNKLNE